jgi:hypothetical protein
MKLTGADMSPRSGLLERDYVIRSNWFHGAPPKESKLETVHLAGFGGGENGRSSTARRRVLGECPAAVQTQGHDGGHYQRRKASLLLSEAGRETPSETGFGSKACPEKAS